MSILTNPQLLEMITKNELSFSPNLDGYQIQPASIDLRIGWSFYIPYTWKYTEQGRIAVVADYMDYSTTHENYQLLKLKPGQYFEIMPGESIIASTLERIKMNNDQLIGMLTPRNSAARRGLSIQSGLVNPHFDGHLTIPIQNNSHHVLKIYPGERLCQVIFHKLDQPVSLEDATMHGLQDPKYDHATPYGLKVKLDSQEELDLLKQGDLEILKKKFNNTNQTSK